MSKKTISYPLEHGMSLELQKIEDSDLTQASRDTLRERGHNFVLIVHSASSENALDHKFTVRLLEEMKNNFRLASQGLGAVTSYALTDGAESLVFPASEHVIMALQECGVLIDDAHNKKVRADLRLITQATEQQTNVSDLVPPHTPGLLDNTPPKPRSGKKGRNR